MSGSQTTIDELIFKVTADSDAATQGIADAAAMFDKANASASNLDETVRRSTPNYDTLSTKFDGAAKTLALTTAATNRYQAAVAAVNAELARGDIGPDVAAANIQRLGVIRDNDFQKARDTGAKVEAQFNTIGVAATASGNSMANAADTASEAHGKLGGSTSAVTREIIVMGHEIVTGNYSRLAGSALVLTEHMGGLLDKIVSVGAWFTTVPGIAVAGLLAVAAAGTIAAVSTENQNLALIKLQENLSLTRDGYLQAATAATTAAKAAAGTTGYTGTATDAKATTAALAAVPDFAATSAALTDLTLLSSKLAVAMGTDLAKATDVLTAGLKNPEAEAKKLAADGMLVLDAATLQTITHLEAAGDVTGAQTLLFAKLHEAVDTTTGTLTPLQQAFRALDDSMKGPGEKSASFFGGLGATILAAAASAIRDVAAGITTLRALTTTGSGAASAGVTTSAPVAMAPGQVTGANMSPDELATFVQDRGTALGLDSGSVAFEQRLLQRETGGTQFDPTTGVLQKNGDSLGAAQINPSTAAMYAPGANLLTEQGNLTALPQVLAGIQRALNTTDPTLTAIGFNGGVGRAEQYRDTPEVIPADVMARLQSYAADVVGKNPPSAVTFPNGVAGPYTSPAYYQAVTDHRQSNATEAGSIDTNYSVDQANITKADSTDFATKKQAAADAITSEQGTLSRLDPGTAQYDAVSKSIDTLKTAFDNIRTPQDEYVNNLQKHAAQAGVTGVADIAVTAALTGLDDAAKHGDGLVTQAQKAAVVSATLANLSAGYRTVSADIAQQETDLAAVGDAYSSGGRAVLQSTNEVKAEAEARKEGYTSGQDYIDVVASLTAKYDDLSDAQQKNKNLSLISDQKDQLEVLNLQASSIGESADQQDRELASLKQIQQLRKEGADLSTDESRSIVTNAVAISDQTAALKLQQQSLSDLQNVGTKAFDDIGTAITDAFTTGSAQAVNFGTIATGILSEIVQYALKIAVLNPVLNSVFGSSLSTLSSTLGVVGNVTGGATGTAASAGTASAGGGGLLSNASSLYSVGKGLYSSFTGGTASTGIAGVDSVLNTSLIGGVSGEAGGTAAATGGAITGSAGAATTGLTAGGLLGGVGAGFAAGSTLNSLVGGNALGGDIGSGVGAAAGSLIGTFVFPGVGTVLGGLLGGSAGGLLGGLFGGGGVQHHGWNVNVGENGGGGLGIVSQGADKFDNSTVVNGIQSEIDALNKVLSSTGTAVATPGDGKVLLGGANGVDQNTTLAQSFSDLRFSSAGDAQLDAALKDRSLVSTTDLANFIAYMQNTYEPLTKVNTGSLAASLDAINTQYAGAIQVAQSYGLATDVLTAAQTKAINQTNANAAASLAATELSYKTRTDTANGNAAGLVTDNAATAAAAAATEMTTLKANLIAVYGDAYAGSADYARTVGELATAQTAEAAAVVNAAATAAAATTAAAQATAAAAQAALDAATEATRQTNAGTALGTVTSLGTYAASLDTSTASPLSPQAQLASALSQFDAVAGAAAAGNYDSLTKVQSYAQNFLSESANVNGSGAQYAADYSHVVDMLAKVTAVSADQLTASVQATIAQKNTDQLVAALANVQGEVKQLRMEIQQAGFAPVRAA